MTEGTLQDRLDALVGKPIGDTGPSVAPDPVNQPMIRHWAAAFEDGNPVYTDPDAAAASCFGEIVAPPLMLQTWTMATPKITGMSRIEAAYEESDKRQFVLPCPVCREFQALKFSQLRWPKGEAEKAAYVCEHCGQDDEPTHAVQSGGGFLTLCASCRAEVVGGS